MASEVGRTGAPIASGNTTPSISRPMPHKPPATRAKAVSRCRCSASRSSGSVPPERSDAAGAGVGSRGATRWTGPPARARVRSAS